MKKTLIILLALFAISCVNAIAQINYIGRYIDEKWLNNEFGSNYIIKSGQFDRETGFLVRGEVSVGNMTLNTSRRGICNSISISSSISSTKKIKEDAERFFTYNNFAIKNRFIDDGINKDETFELLYEGERHINGKYVTITAKARGSYNSFGEYFPSFYYKYIIAVGYE